MDGARTRMSRAQRREQLLDAAAHVVAVRGFTATTTDAVAAAAGVSQPYVVRAFGGKGELLTALYERVVEQVLAAFRAVPPGPDADQALGEAYVALVGDHDLLRVLLHGFSATADPAIGNRARAVLADVHRLYRERTGGDAEAAGNFLARGMLINVLLAVDAPTHAADDAALADLVRSFLGPGALDDRTR